MSGDVQVLARIDASRFYDRPEAYRQEVREWLRANGVDPEDVTVRRDVEVVLLDGPAIAREEWVRDAHGSLQIDFDRDEPLSHVVHSLLRVPLPEHLADPA